MKQPQAVSAEPGASGGFVTLSFVAVVGLTMILLVMFSNLLAVHYARGVLQSAVEEGARQGVAVGTVDGCRQRAQQVVDSGLGAMAKQVSTVGCTVESDSLTAAVTATFAPWLPLLPSQAVAVRAVVRSESTR